jgi:hypothetical protein
MAIGVNDAVAQDVLNALNTEFDGGVLEFRAGARPGSSNNAATGAVVAAIDPLPADSFAAPVGRTISKLGVWQDLVADSTGVIGWARLRNQADTKRLDFSVTVTGGGGDITVDRTDIVAGQQFTVTAMSLTYPGA